MHCRICGTEKNVRMMPSKGHQAMCPDCSKETPKKASRENFLRAYFGPKWEDVPQGIRGEFFSDYLASTHTVPEYIEATTTQL
jgi:hypothetical protein